MSAPHKPPDDSLLGELVSSWAAATRLAAERIGAECWGVASEQKVILGRVVDALFQVMVLVEMLSRGERIALTLHAGQAGSAAPDRQLADRYGSRHMQTVTLATRQLGDGR